MAFSMVDSNSSMKESSHVKCFRKVSKPNKKVSNEENLANVNVNNAIDDCNKCINQTRLNNIEDIVSTNQDENEDSNTHYCNDSTTSLRSINLSGCWSITDYGLR
jgi:hypothetical protein